SSFSTKSKASAVPKSRISPEYLRAPWHRASGGREPISKDVSRAWRRVVERAEEAMSDPRRIVEETGLAGALLRAGAEELPSEETVRKVVLAMGAGVAIASSSAAAGAASVAAGAGGSALSKVGAPITFAVLGKWLGIGTLTGLITVTSASQIERAQSHHLVAY